MPELVYDAHRDEWRYAEAERRHPVKWKARAEAAEQRVRELERRIEAIRERVADDFVLVPFGESRFALDTPLTYPDGGSVVVYFTWQSSELLEITDYGEGYSIATARRGARRTSIKTAAAEICGSLALEFSDGRISAVVGPEEAGDALWRVATASARLADAFSRAERPREKEIEELERANRRDEPRLHEGTALGQGDSVTNEWDVVLEAVSLAYDEPSEAHSALERIRDHVEDAERRVRELEEALREIAAMDGATWYDDPSAGFAAVARRALGQEMEG